ncbi:MAG: hypothetical protein L0K84_04690, partial [Acidipropionibacterium jensenii]|nr:hypothetical protein [Acidipropionibacterium jensenii]
GGGGVAPGLGEGGRGGGVGVTPRAPYWGGAGAEHGLVLGFGAHDDATLAHSLRRVASIIGGRIDPV